MGRGLPLAVLVVVAAACPMPNPAWLESAVTGDGSSTETHSGSASTASSTASTDVTAATTQGTGSASDSTATEPTTSATTSTTTNDMTITSTSTSSSTSMGTSTTANATDTDASSSTGEPSCEALSFSEGGGFDLTLDVVDIVGFPKDNKCGDGVFEFTGGPNIMQVMPNRWAYIVESGLPCAGLPGSSISVTGTYPPLLKPNLVMDCAKIRVFIAWDEVKQACAKVSGFEILAINMNNALYFAAASGRLTLGDGNSVSLSLKESCSDGGLCNGSPGLYSLKSEVAMGPADEVGVFASAAWDFYNLRSHVHDAPDPDVDDKCLSHFDWALNKK